MIPSVEVDSDSLSIDVENCSNARFDYFYEEE